MGVGYTEKLGEMSLVLVVIKRKAHNVPNWSFLLGAGH